MQVDEGFEPQVGEIRALRTFRVGPGGVLYPLFSSEPWQDGDNHAHCRMQDAAEFLGEAHDVPEPQCTCGFYAYGNEHAAAEYPHARHVLAVVACWGRTIVGTQGLRTECCRVEALWFDEAVPHELVEGIQRHYPTVQVFADKSVMLQAHPLSVVDGYQFSDERRKESWLRFARCALAVAVVLTAIPTQSWSWSARLGWTAWLCALVAVLLASRSLGRRTIADRRAGSTANRYRVLLAFVALWMLAPLAGATGSLLLRLPLLQIGVLVMMQRNRLAREARRFPATID
jgi:hypothetical protein